MKKAKIAVLVSGGGTNLQALLDAQAAGLLPRRTMDVDEALARRVLSGEKPKLDGERGWTLLQWRGLPVGFLKTGT